MTEAFAEATEVTPANKGRLLAGAPFHFRLASNIAERLHYGALVFVLPDGRALRFSGAEATGALGVIEVKDYNFAWRAVFGGGIGFYESYAAGQWDSPDITDVLYVFAKNADYVNEALAASPAYRFFKQIRHKLHRNTREGAKRNVMAHYDLGNSFYEKWLDRSMTYSSAKFNSPGEDLMAAQHNKYESLARSIGLQEGESVLEIGSGWGGFAEFAAKEAGAKVTGLTISPSQYGYAKERIFREGLSERVDFRLQDYRDADGQYDKIASIEMFEAVGKEYWSTYFGKVRDLLKPGGAAGLQIITIADRFFEGYSRSTDFIQQYVFPGGMLPSPSILRQEIEKAGLVWKNGVAFGQDYARTLSEWRNRFLASWDDIQSMGFDDRFKKLWRYYLSYCEAGFKAATTDVIQVELAKA